MHISPIGLRFPEPNHWTATLQTSNALHFLDEPAPRIPPTIRGSPEKVVETMAETSLSIDYAPLSEPTEIRILILQHGVDNDPIQCTLRHSLMHKEYYQALSYEWRDTGDEDPNITVNGSSVRIRENLHEALKQIRDAAEDLFLWIDALCINQTNLGEESQQVGLMGEIFGCANCVIAWLGIQKDDSAVAMQLMNRGWALEYLPPVTSTTSDTKTIFALLHRPPLAPSLDHTRVAPCPNL